MKRFALSLLLLLSLGLMPASGELIVLEETTTVYATKEEPKVMMEALDLQELTRLIDERDVYEKAYLAEEREKDHWKERYSETKEDLGALEIRFGRMKSAFYISLGVSGALALITTVAFLVR